jgi:hypothetical protein
MEIGAQHGFEFTTQELDDVLRQIRDALTSELPEGELEKVAGGISAVPLGPSDISWKSAQPDEWSGFIGSSLARLKGEI